MDGQVSGLGTVNPLLTLSFVSTWSLPLHVVSSTLKRKSSSSVMDGLQRRRYIYKSQKNYDVDAIFSGTVINVLTMMLI